MRRKTIHIVLLMLLATLTVVAQTNTNSPFTRYGYGELEDGCYSRSQSMGNACLGLYSPLHINPANPATYTSTDSTTFLFEIGLSGLVSDYKSLGNSQTSFTGKLDYVAFQTPITKWLGLSAGLLPYSYVGYAYQVDDSIALAGEKYKQKYTEVYQGAGGISQVFLGLTFNILNYVTLGANGYYMFGNLNRYRTFAYSSSDLSTTSAIITEKQHISNFNVRFGLQYHQPIGRRHQLTLGAIYEFRSALAGDYTMYKYAVDTLNIEFKNEDYFEMPQVWGVGFAYEFDKRLTIAGDFTMQEFANALYAGARDSLANRMKIALGAEYIHNPVGRNYIDRMWWRLGANWRTSYVRINGQNTADWSITMGIGFPLRTTRTILHFNMEYCNIASGQFEALKEQYFKFGFSFSINETWFVKSKVR